MEPRRMTRLAEMEMVQPDDAYPLVEFLDDTRAAVWGDLGTASALDGYRRALQRSYLERVKSLMTEQPASNPFQGAAPAMDRSDIRPLLRAQLAELRGDVDRATRRIRHRVTRAHLQDALERIDGILDADDEEGGL
jgi:hypothetical protein